MPWSTAHPLSLSTSSPQATPRPGTRPSDVVAARAVPSHQCGRAVHARAGPRGGGQHRRSVGLAAVARPGRPQRGQGGAAGADPPGGGGIGADGPLQRGSPRPHHPRPPSSDPTRSRDCGAARCSAAGAAARRPGRAVRYLLEAEAVTGECLTVDGGEQYGDVRERFHRHRHRSRRRRAQPVGPITPRSAECPSTRHRTLCGVAHDQFNGQDHRVGLLVGMVDEPVKRGRDCFREQGGVEADRGERRGSRGRRIRCR